MFASGCALVSQLVSAGSWRDVTASFAIFSRSQAKKQKRKQEQIAGAMLWRMALAAASKFSDLEAAPGFASKFASSGVLNWGSKFASKFASKLGFYLGF